MKAGWIKTTLGEAFTTSTGSTPPKSNLNFYGQFMPLVKPPELCDSTLDSAEDGLSESGAQVARTVPPNSILVSCIGNLGKIGMNTVPVAFNQQINAIHPDSTKAVPEFMFFQTLGGRFREQLEAMASGTTVPIVNKSKFNSIEIVLPPLPEQQRIVTLLDEAFDGIATAKANAEKNLQNARAIFESHLQAVFTQQGVGWQKKTLAEISTIFGRGKSRHRPRNEPKLYGGKYPFIQTGDIRNSGHFITEYSQTYSELGLAQSKLWPKGTICITIAANIAETGILDFDACFPDSVIGVVPNPAEAEVGFVEYLLQSFKVRIQALGQGSAQANINMGTFENERFPFPGVAEQRRIVAKLDDLSEETQRLETIYQHKLTALDELKKSLLHRAFSGDL
jgi:type I restriction enzyme S subunit